MKTGLLGLWFAAVLSACTTAPQPVELPEAGGSSTTRVIIAQPQAVPPAPPIVTRPPPPVTEAPDEPVIEAPSQFAALSGWTTVDAAPALNALRRSCKVWQDADPDAYLAPRLPQYGTFSDWIPACRAADTNIAPKAFFESFFEPVTLATLEGETGLLTGYYEPEVPVRRRSDSLFSEPILARPKTDALRLQPRKDITAETSRVIAYGRPADVFFMQIQGSGRIVFPDGLSLRAAYAGHNGHPYTSIGRKLVEWGEMELHQASKAAIESWMDRAGPMRTKALMNTNERYIFFEEQSIPGADGPNPWGPQGAMRAPLTAMGSIAVDPRYHPYGTVALLQTRLPRRPGDFRAAPATLLVVAQDTGGAIKGPLRGDLFFGAGTSAGDLAGVMKHPVRWTVLLPRALSGAS